ncbi:MAG: DivIVA domain-containing protein [Clostridia bacterium]|nr:DivIVA domain-containing protein [Clostridia bacterium]
MLPPHELKNKTFGKAMRGYNPVEVDEYIEFLIEKYTELYRENDELERKLKATMTRLDEIKSDEDSIRSALIDAKRAAAKIKSDAEERAEAIIRAAKTSCNTILADFNEKIEYGRETYAELQRDTLSLRNELFERYSEHIRYIDKLTEGIDEEEIPEISELRRQAMDVLKAEIAGKPAPAAEPAPEEEEPAAPEEEPMAEDADEDAIPVDQIFGGAPADDPDDAPAEELETVREPLTSGTGLKGSIKELNKIYKESAESDVINTPDSDLGDDASYLDFVKSVTGKTPAKDDKKEADFEALFDDGKKKKK